MSVTRAFQRRAPAALLILALAPAEAPAQKQALDHAAYDLWRTIRGERLSPDGRWVLYELALRVDDGELVIRESGGAQHRVPRGTDGRFTPDSRNAVFTVEPARDSVRTLKLREAARADLPPDTIGILTLATGSIRRAPASDWSMTEEGRGVVAWLERTPTAAPPGDSAGAAPELHTLTVREMGSGQEWRFHGVTAYALAREGSRVAYAAAGAGAGVYVVDPRTGEARAILAGDATYAGLALSRDGRQVAFLTDRDDRESEQPSWSLYHWRAGRDSAARLAREGANGIPDGWWISERADVRFSRDGGRLFFGTEPRPVPAVAPDSLPEDERVELDVWHWRDPYIQPMQLATLEEEGRPTYEAVVLLDRRNRVVQLETPATPSVEVGAEGDADVALAETGVPYRHLVGIEAPAYSDVWLIDVRTGERRRVLQRRRVTASLSPTGRYLAWYDFDDRQWRALDIPRQRAIDLSAGIPFPVWDEEDDHPMPPDPYGLAGWTADDEEVLIHDRYDLWALDPDGRSTPRRITEGHGREHRLRFRYEALDPDEPGIPRDRPLLLSAYDEVTRESGFFRDRVDGSAAPQRLVLEPKRFELVAAADSAPVLLYTREDVAEFPDLWVADPGFGRQRRVSRANPQQAEYNWATVELVEWLSGEGLRLQGLLYRPEDFDPSRSYPMMVTFYERNSEDLHAHHPPLPHRSVIRPTFYASRGYLVFVPDIRYEDGFPGESAADAIMPGVLKLAPEPWVDETNVGVQGHSWGGYQIAYLLTQTDFFRAAAAGAPVANMTSAYGGIRWGSGMSRMFQYERTQSRIGGTLWDMPLRYLENSPLFFLDKVDTPLLIMHNDADSAVPWSQGIELFMGLRRLGKPVWMIVYNDAPHWPTTPAAIRDWNIRMQQYFDHYLKGAPAPRWLVDGIPATEKGRTLGLETVEPVG